MSWCSGGSGCWPCFPAFPPFLLALVSAISAAPTVPRTVEEVLRPADVDCSNSPEWETFRIAAAAHSRNGWNVEANDAKELEVMSRRLVDKWRWVVCKEDCQTTQHLAWVFVEDWGARCKSSANFDRYLITHYFRNRRLEFVQREPFGYCHFGFITALVVAAQFEFPHSVAQAGRMLFLAYILLGDFFAFDWLKSSSWPVDSLMVMLNVHIVSQRLLVGPDLEQIRAAGRRPGLEGPGFLRFHSRWQGTSEDGKQTSREACAGSDVLPELRIWQYDAHTALAGEAKTMLTRFGDAMQVRVSFLGNSFPGNVCRNYGLCAQPEDKELLEGLLKRYYKDKQAFATVAAAFEEALRFRLSREADVLMCSQPLSWCRFLLGMQKPMLLYAGLPVMWDLPEADRDGWAADFSDILRSQKHVVIANSVFVAREVQWQFGMRVPTLRPLGLHTNAMHVPVRNSSVLVSRFGTSGGLSECLLEKFAIANRHWFPLEFVQMESLLFQEHLASTGDDELEDAKTWEEHTGEIKVPHMPYNKLASHRAVVCMPYDTSIFLFNEFYSANMPVFVPGDLWRWLIGPVTSPMMEYRHWTAEEATEGVGPVPTSSPFYASVHQPMGVEQALEWSMYSDWAMLPHVLYFEGIPDLFLKLMDTTSLHQTSIRMKVFNDEELILAVENWKKLVRRLIYAVGDAT
ncbi:unnamed protein product [Symbiodinium natans]|uniref:Uncharacterized protein n=1 Tax=Symbiodinium natans TaxID=878477 RepID=A0A812PQI9_9DINO|nr:unnamed protein product [Symbiodinium natans]